MESAQKVDKTVINVTDTFYSLLYVTLQTEHRTWCLDFRLVLVWPIYMSRCLPSNVSVEMEGVLLKLNLPTHIGFNLKSVGLIYILLPPTLQADLVSWHGKQFPPSPLSVFAAKAP